MRTGWVVFLSLAIFAVASTADAARRPKKPDKLEEAKRLFYQAEIEFKLGRFDEALSLFSKAYEASVVPAFLFNIGQCHYNLGNYERALFFYEGYLRDEPNNPNAETVRVKIEEARQAIKKKEEGRPVAATQPIAVVAPVVAEAPLAARSEAAVVAPEPVYKKWWLWTIVGVVVAGGVATTVVLVTQPKPPALIDWRAQ